MPFVQCTAWTKKFADTPDGWRRARAAAKECGPGSKALPDRLMAKFPQKQNVSSKRTDDGDEE